MTIFLSFPRIFHVLKRASSSTRGRVWLLPINPLLLGAGTHAYFPFTTHCVCDMTQTAQKTVSNSSIVACVFVSEGTSVWLLHSDSRLFWLHYSNIQMLLGGDTEPFNGRKNGGKGQRWKTGSQQISGGKLVAGERIRNRQQKRKRRNRESEKCAKIKYRSRFPGRDLNLGPLESKQEC
jgi:hypothetical protein